MNGLLVRYPNAIPISARRGAGLSQLAGAVSDALSRNFLDVDVETGVENGRLQAFLSAHGEVLSKSYQDSRVVIHCRIAENHLGRIRDEAIAVRPRSNGNGNGYVGADHAADGRDSATSNGQPAGKKPLR